MDDPRGRTSSRERVDWRTVVPVTKKHVLYENIPYREEEIRGLLDTAQLMRRIIDAFEGDYVARNASDYEPKDDDSKPRFLIQMSETLDLEYRGRLYASWHIDTPLEDIERDMSVLENVIGLSDYVIVDKKKKSRLHIYIYSLHSAKRNRDIVEKSNSSLSRYRE